MIFFFIFSALPPQFKEGLANKECVEGESVKLHCTLTKPKASLEWRKGQKTLKPGDKYKFVQEGLVAELVISRVDLDDAGEYVCVCGDQQTKASLNVKGNGLLMISTIPFLLIIPCHPTSSSKFIIHIHFSPSAIFNFLTYCE